MTRLSAVLSLFSLLVFAFSSHAQVSITTLGPAGAYTQNFDSMGTTDFALTNNTSITGVYAFRTTGDTGTNTFFADTGTSTTGRFNNYGSAGAPDRTLGSLGSGTPDDQFYGVRFVNNSGVQIASVEVTYTGEQWRAANTTSHNLSFDYRQDMIVDSLETGVFMWTAVGDLVFTTPTNTTDGALDGNAMANRVTLTGSFLVTIPVGQEIMIRWQDQDDIGTDHGYGIDDLTVIFRAAPTAAGASINGRVVAANGRGISKTYVTLSGGSLPGPVYALTNAFGYYTLENIPSGQTYTLTVSSKRYQFANTTRVINLDDNLTGIDFTADP